VNLVHTAKLAPGGVVAFLRRHAAARSRPDLHFEVRLQFRGHVGFKLPAAEQGGAAGKKSGLIGTHGAK